MAGKHDAYIIKVIPGPNQPPEYRVRPAVWAGKHGATFKIRNMTDRKWDVAFDRHALAAGERAKQTLQPCDPSGSKKTDRCWAKLSSDAPAGCYSYTVTQAKTVHLSAWGESDPVIIIDP